MGGSSKNTRYRFPSFFKRALSTKLPSVILHILICRTGDDTFIRPNVSLYRYLIKHISTGNSSAFYIAPYIHEKTANKHQTGAKVPIINRRTNQLSLIEVVFRWYMEVFLFFFSLFALASSQRSKKSIRGAIRSLVRWMVANFRKINYFLCYSFSLNFTTMRKNAENFFSKPLKETTKLAD